MIPGSAANFARARHLVTIIYFEAPRANTSRNLPLFRMTLDDPFQEYRFCLSVNLTPGQTLKTVYSRFPIAIFVLAPSPPVITAKTPLIGNYPTLGLKF